MLSKKSVEIITVGLVTLVLVVAMMLIIPGAQAY